MRLTLIFLTAITLLFSACKPEEKPVTKEQAAQFATGLAKAAGKREHNFISSRIIIPAFADRIIKVEPSVAGAGLAADLAKGMASSQLDAKLLALVGMQGSFEQVKQYEKNGQQRIIFRAFGEGINYYDLELTSLDGKVGIADILVYTSGENLSRSMADVFDGLKGQGKESYEDFADRMQSIRKLSAKGNYIHAKREFDLLPASIRDNIAVAVMGMQIASNLDEQVYLEEIEKFEKAFGNNPLLQLSMLDLYFLKEDYVRANKAIDNVDGLINKDPFLNYYRGIIANQMGEKDKAISYHEAVTVSNPDFPGSYAELMVYAIEKGDKINATKYYKLYKNLPKAKQDIISSYAENYPYLIE